MLSNYALQMLSPARSLLLSLSLYFLLSSAEQAVLIDETNAMRAMAGA